MPNDPCPTAYRTQRLAKRAAWADASRGQRTEPYNCIHCGQWHLRQKDAA